MTMQHRLLATAGTFAACVALLLLLTVPSSFGAYTARVTNSNNTISTATYFTCTAASTGLGASLAWPLDDAYVTTGTVGARDVSGNNRTGVYSLTGVAYRQGTNLCPRDRTTSTDNFGTILDGQTGYVTYPTAFPLTNTFTESLWFSTATTRGGRLIGFGNSPTGASTDYDRQIWMGNDGTLSFGVCPTNCFQQVTSPKAYNDGQRHHVVATLGTNGMRLYVDGVQVASSSNTLAQNYAVGVMYLRVGYDNLTYWNPAPTSYYFNGYVRFADYFTSQLTASQVNQLYLAGTGA